jgi:ketosteroid isomerase-like protein
MLLRFPRAAVAVTRLVRALPRESRLRKGLTRRLAQRGIEALNRKDFEAAFSLYHPDIELVTDHEVRRLGFEERYRGIDERVAFQRRWLDEWGDFEFVPRLLIDLGEELFFEGRVVGAGASSGAGFENYWGALITLSGGHVVREHFFFDERQAREAAGLAD